MYALLVMWGGVSLYCHLRIFEDEEDTSWYIVAGILTFLGMFTHYYYLLYQFFISACSFIWLCMKRKWKKAGLYAFCIFSALVVFVLSWPAVIEDIFSSYRGVEAFQNFMSGESKLFAVLKGLGNR